MTTIQQPVPPAPTPRGPAPQPRPRNGLAVAVLTIGIVTLVLSPVPVLDGFGLLTSVVGLALGVPAMLIGVRHRVRMVMATVGTLLSFVALISSLSFIALYDGATSSSASSYAPVTAPSTPAYQAPTYTAPTYSAPAYTPSYSAPAYTPTYEAPVYTPPAPEIYTYKITGPNKASITYSTKGGGSSQATNAKVPWSKKVEEPGYATMPFAYVSAQNSGGGSISCQIIGPSGDVIAENTAEGEYAIVTCQG